MRIYDYIVNVVCQGESIHPDILSGNIKLRKRELVFTRQLILFFMKEFTGYSLAKIGAHMGKDHATVMHAIKTVNNLTDTDKGIAVKVDLYREKIRLVIDFSYAGSLQSIKATRDSITYCLANKIEIPEEVLKRYNDLVKDGKW